MERIHVLRHASVEVCIVTSDLLLQYKTLLYFVSVGHGPTFRPCVTI